MKRIFLNLKRVLNPKSGKVGLVPADDDTRLYLDNCSEDVILEVSKPRNADRHRAFFKMLSLFIEHCNFEVLKRLVNDELTDAEADFIADRVRESLLIKVGFVTTRTVQDTIKVGLETYEVNRLMKTAKSQSFDNLKEDDFIALFNAVKAVIFDCMRESGWQTNKIEETFKELLK
jgi:hypothetical protein